MATLARVDFKPDWFNDLNSQKGARINWYKALMCSCAVNNKTGQPDQNCPYCDGFGFIYQNPVETTVYAQSIATLPEFMVAGYAQFGELLITPKNEISMSVYDRIEFLDFAIIHTHSVLRRSGNTDLNRYYIINPEFVFYEGIYYQFGIDFNVNGKQIIWITPNRPPENAQYTIRYTTHPVYLLSKPIHEKRATFVKNPLTGDIEYKPLPTQWIAKKEFELQLIG